jgi:CopG family transcriptional regulator, nickel-responsive regulator
MTNLVRFGVSIEDDLLQRFDALIERAGQANRSEAVRDLIRARLVEDATQSDDASGFGVLTLVYDHHQRDLHEQLTALQHDHAEMIISTLHVHIDHCNCLEVILLKGGVGPMRILADSLAGFKGVQHSRLVLTSVER